MNLGRQYLDERGRFSELTPVAVIDIGSNSVRLVVYEGAVRAVTPLFNEKVLCGLGRYVAATGRLGDEGIERALSALARFRAIADAFGVGTLQAFATAAVREASDGYDFLQRGEKVLKSQIRVLSGSEEAHYAALGIRMAFPDVDGVVGDLGGGSLELINMQDGAENTATTLPLGGLRLIEASGGKLDKAVGLVDAALDGVDWLDRVRGRTFYSVGGTWRAFARLHMERTGYPLHVMQGYRIPTHEAITLAEELRKTKKTKDVRGIGVVSPSRREVLPFGAAALERLLVRLQPKGVVVSVFGVREGIVYDMLPEEERRSDPLLSFCLDYARLRSRSAEHALELCAWTTALFERKGLGETPQDRRLRHAACLLSDIGWRAHPDYRGEQSLNVIAHAALSGIDHSGRVFLALTAYFRHMGKGSNGADSFSSRLKTLISRRDQQRARMIGLAVRAAHMLAVGMPGIIPRTKLSYEGDALVLDMEKSLAPLDGERVRKRFATLAEVVGCRLKVRIGGAEVR